MSQVAPIEPRPGRRPLRVLVVTTVYPSARQPNSGAFVRGLVDALRAQHVDVSVVAPRPLAREMLTLATRLVRKGDGAPSSEGDAAATVMRPSYLSVSSRVFPGRLGRRLQAWGFRRAVARAVASLPERPDVMYAQFLTTASAVAPIASALSIPCVAAVGDSGIDEYDATHGTSWASRVLGCLSGVVTVSEENQDFVVRRRPDASLPILHIQNAVDLERFVVADQAAARRALGLNEAEPLVLFAGGFVERKGPLRVLRAVELLSGVRAVFLGDGPEQPSGPRVAFAGPVPHQDVPTWMAAADVFVLPSLAEGMSNAILEAMACGLPVVVSDRRFNRSFIRHPHARFVDPTVPERIAEGIRSALDLPTRSLAFREESRRLAPLLSLADRAATIRSFLEGLAGGQPGARALAIAKGAR